MRLLLLVTAAALLVGAAPAKKLLTPNDIVAEAPASAWKTIPADDLLVMDLANGGRIVIQLAPEVAPVTVNNFVILATHGFYTGLNFWKSEDWVVQGGDPRGDGRGGPGYSLPDETTVTPWGLAAVGMARVPGGAVNGSQFFVEKADWPAPGPSAAYNRFGTVISGMDKVQLLTSTDTITSITIKVY